MNRIRAFTHNDIPAVSDMYMRVFCRSSQPSSPALASYFEEMIFQNPWADTSYPSLVYESENGITGFLGVLPRPMIFQGKPIMAAIATQFMVERKGSSGFPAIDLMNQFLAGPQDLSFTDGATDAASSVWQLIGGQWVLLYCLEWIRIFRPARYAMSILQAKQGLTPVMKALGPVGWMADRLANALPIGPYRTPETHDVEEEASSETILDCISEFTRHRALRPYYDKQSLAWLVKQAGLASHRGRLRQAVVRDAKGGLLGWYICHIKPGGLCQMLQFGGKGRTLGRVIQSAIHHSFHQGTLAISGQLDPIAIRILADNRCTYKCLSLGVCAHSRNPDILTALHRGDAFLTRMEGEWWMHFRNAAEGANGRSV